MLTKQIKNLETKSNSPDNKANLVKEDSLKVEEMNKLLNKKLFKAENYEQTPISKNHRRSKSYLKGRDYLCSICWKSYLSYAAMYVHLKAKHKATISQIKISYSKY